MGLLNQAIRNLKRALKNIFKRKKKGRSRREEPDEVPGKWIKEDSPVPQTKKKTIVVKSHKLRIPGLLWFKRILAGFLLLINFVLSQFLLGSIGEGAQPMFVLFLLNSFIILDYLWKTRRRD